MTDIHTYTAFLGFRRIAAGTRSEVVPAVRQAQDGGEGLPLVFENATGRQVDFDLSDHGAPGDAVEQPDAGRAPTMRGRPKLGVVAREVTLLPRHWEWLNAQPGGASVALRKLVESARKAGAFEEVGRLSREAASRFMAAVGGNLPGYEEACRALFAGDRTRFEVETAEWPEDVRDYALALAAGAYL